MERRVWIWLLASMDQTNMIIPIIRTKRRPRITNNTSQAPTSKEYHRHTLPAISEMAFGAAWRSQILELRPHWNVNPMALVSKVPGVTKYAEK